jgi:tetratricopeptide (TPR) repeat protein
MRRFKQAGLEGRANAYLGIGKHEEAIADYETVLKIDPNGDGPLNNLAWVLATSPMDSLRDGERAIELATKACEVTDYNAPHILSTLAAGYAEAGNWEEAVKRSTEAVEKLDAQLKQQEETRKIPPTPTQLETQKQLQNELKSYEEKKPWRELQDILNDKKEKEAVADSDASDESSAEGSDSAE